MKVTQVQYDRNDLLLEVNFDMGKKFYLGYENDPKRQASILFENWDWIQKRFGEDFAGLNEGRKNQIEAYKTCLEFNIPMFEHTHIQNYKDGKFMRPSDKLGDRDPKNNYEQRLVEYHPVRLDENGRKKFQDNIDLGLLILCEMI